MLDRLRRRKLKGNTDQQSTNPLIISSGEKSPAIEACPPIKGDSAQGFLSKANGSHQTDKQDVARPLTGRAQNYRKRRTWGDNSNARSTASSTSNEDDPNNAKALISDASWRRQLSTANGLRGLGTRFSWSDTSQSKTSVTSMSEDESFTISRKDTSRLADVNKSSTTPPSTASKLRNFGRKLSRNEIHWGRLKRSSLPNDESPRSTKTQLPLPSSKSSSAITRDFSRFDRPSLSRNSHSLNENEDDQEHPSISFNRSGSSSAFDFPNIGGPPSESISNHRPFSVDKLLASRKRHSWAGSDPKKVYALSPETLTENTISSLGSSAHIQTVMIRKPSAADRQNAAKRYSWAQINEERSKALSILEEGNSTTARKDSERPAAVLPPQAGRRPSTSNKLEAFKKRHSLSDYKELRGRPLLGSHNLDLNPTRTWSPGAKPRRPSPPRRTSTSDRVRSFSRRLSTPNSIWGIPSGNSPAGEDNYDPAVTKIVSSETLQLRRSNTAPLPTLPPPPAHMIPQSSPLLSLPTELLHQLPPYLPPSAVVSLRQTCSRLHTTLGLLPHSSSSSLSPSSTFTFLLMLDRDNLTTYAPSTPPRLLCGSCRCFHPRSAFPAAHVSLHPLQRSCRQLWLCPHKSYTHPRAAKFLRPPQDSNTLFITKNIDPCPRCRDSIRHRVAADPTNTIITTKIALLQRPTPLPRRGQAPDVFPVRDVSAALQALNFRICPHIRISDHLLLSRFCRVCLSTRSVKANGKCIQDCNSERLNYRGYSGGKCKGQCFKKGCNTGWMFQARESLKPDASGRRQVWLVLGVWRGLGKLKTPDDDNPQTEEIIWDPDSEENDDKTDVIPTLDSNTRTGDKDPAWVGHTVDAPERAAMRKHLEEWNRGAGGGGKCLPDWSICLLHPEDGGLGIGAI